MLTESLQIFSSQKSALKMGSHGYRCRTRSLFRQDYRKRGVARVSKYLENYEIGDYVDIKVNPANHKGMPHKVYHGRTGQVFDVTKSSVKVVLLKRVRGKHNIKQVVARLEHVRKSRCREDHLRRLSLNEERRREAEEKGIAFVPIKRTVAGPLPSMVVSTRDNEPVEVGYEPYISVL
jgi:large subunit ribosomal protein L21e